jgi:hypothetical protein
MLTRGKRQLRRQRCCGGGLRESLLHLLQPAALLPACTRCNRGAAVGALRKASKRMLLQAIFSAASTRLLQLPRTRTLPLMPAGLQQARTRMLARIAQGGSRRMLQRATCSARAFRRSKEQAGQLAAAGEAAAAAQRQLLWGGGTLLGGGGGRRCRGISKTIARKASRKRTRCCRRLLRRSLCRAWGQLRRCRRRPGAYA